MTERSITDIIGWHRDGYFRPGYKVDDLLSWLRERGVYYFEFNIYMGTPEHAEPWGERGNPGVHLWVDENHHETFSGSTLLEALEIVVRAVAE